MVNELLDQLADHVGGQDGTVGGGSGAQLHEAAQQPRWVIEPGRWPVRGGTDPRINRPP